MALSTLFNFFDQAAISPEMPLLFRSAHSSCSRSASISADRNKFLWCRGDISDDVIVSILATLKSIQLDKMATMPSALGESVKFKAQG
jgi:hypothetical protein